MPIVIAIFTPPTDEVFRLELLINQHFGKFNPEVAEIFLGRPNLRKTDSNGEQSNTMMRTCQGSGSPDRSLRSAE
jgi:hypothetical protein